MKRITLIVATLVMAAAAWALMVVPVMTMTTSAKERAVQALISPLTSPLVPTPAVAFTPAYTAYMPMVSTRPNIVGAEIDNGYTSPYTGLFQGASFGWYRWVSANWVDVQPASNTQWIWGNDSITLTRFTQAYSDGLQVIAVIRTVPK